MKNIRACIGNLYTRLGLLSCVNIVRNFNACIRRNRSDLLILVTSHYCQKNSNSKQTEKKLIFHKFIILQYTTQSYHFFAESVPLNAHKTYYKQLKNIKIATALVIKHDRGEDTTRLRCFHNTTAVKM